MLFHNSSHISFISTAHKLYNTHDLTLVFQTSLIDSLMTIKNSTMNNHQRQSSNTIHHNQSNTQSKAVIKTQSKTNIKDNQHNYQS